MLRAMASGFVGACALTVSHQLINHSRPDAPRLDKLGMQSLDKILKFAGVSLTEEQLFQGSLWGDLLLNTLYFSQVGDNKGFGAIVKGLTLGLTMGAGAVTLPGALPVDENATRKTPATMAMTIAIYGIGGLSAALAAQIIGQKKARR
jgi:hypothetical protein